jgi:RimJ/RimL family protein N-acetyltransferase
LSSYTTNIYATVRQENKAMKHILEKFGFTKSGSSYKSDRKNYDIELYIKKEKSAL